MGAQEWWGSQDGVEILTLGAIGPESGGINRAVAMEPAGRGIVYELCLGDRGSRLFIRAVGPQTLLLVAGRRLGHPEGYQNSLQWKS